MPFISELLKNRSVSIVGMAKNTGKTTCLNYILNRLAQMKINFAVTSIGVDGEERDVLYDTLKPRINIYKGNYFITTEKHFNDRKLEASIIDIDEHITPLGRLFFARAESDGQVILSGPSDAVRLKKYISNFEQLGIEITLVDGALSRMSLASPSITDAMILCTGAAYSFKLEYLIKQVRYICNTIMLPQVEKKIVNQCENINCGVWEVTPELQLDKKTDSLFVDSVSNIKLENNLYISGVLTGDFLEQMSIFLLQQKNNVPQNNAKLKLIIKDFSRIFANAKTYYKFFRRGGEIFVLEKANLLAVCSNPTSPVGYNYEAEKLRSSLEEKLNIAVYDIVEIRKNNIKKNI